MNYNELQITIRESEIPNIITSQFSEIEKIKKNIDKLIEKANRAYKSVNDAYGKDAFWHKKAAIESLQTAAKDIVEAQISEVDAQKAFFEYQERLCKIIQYLFGIGVSSLAANRSVIRELELKLKGASEETLDDFARQEIINVVRQLKAQEDILSKQEHLMSKQKEARDKIVILDGQLKAQCNKNDDFEKKISEQNQTTKEHGNQLRIYKATIADQGKKIQEHEKNFNAQQKKNSDFAEKISNQNKTSEEHSRQLKRCKDIIATQEKKIQEYEKGLEEQRNNNNELKNEIDKQIRKVESHDKLIQELTYENARLKEIIKLYESEFQTMSNNVNRLFNSKWRIMKKR